MSHLGNLVRKHSEQIADRIQQAVEDFVIENADELAAGRVTITSNDRLKVSDWEMAKIFEDDFEFEVTTDEAPNGRTIYQAHFIGSYEE